MKTHLELMRELNRIMGLIYDEPNGKPKGADKNGK